MAAVRSPRRHPVPRPAAVGLGHALASLLLLGVGAAGAQVRLADLPDPTRPPPGMPLSARPAGPVGGAGPLPGLLPGVPPTAAATPLLAPGPATLPAARPAPPEPPRVQGLHLPRGGDPSALIDGRIVSVGDRVGGLVITLIDADGVVLRGPRGPERLPLLAPTPARTPAAPRSDRPGPPTTEPAAQVAGKKEP